MVKSTVEGLRTAVHVDGEAGEALLHVLAGQRVGEQPHRDRDGGEQESRSETRARVMMLLSSS